MGGLHDSVQEARSRAFGVLQLPIIVASGAVITGQYTAQAAAQVMVHKRALESTERMAQGGKAQLTEVLRSEVVVQVCHLDVTAKPHQPNTIMDAETVRKHQPSRTSVQRPSKR